MAIEKNSTNGYFRLDPGKQRCLSFKSVGKVVWEAEAIWDESALVISDFK
jgi:hypothetical protein